MEKGRDFSLCGKAAVTEANLRDEYFWKLVADFIGPQSGEGLELHKTPCKNRLLIQVGLMTEDNNFPWMAVVNWLKKIFPWHQSADFRRLIERGIATTLSLGSEARQTFLESEVNFHFVGPICDSIGVERQHLLEMRDFSEQAQSIEVTNGLILELSNFVTREKIAPVVLVTWLRNFNPEFCENGNIQKAYKVLRSKIKNLKMCYRNYETRSHRRNAAMENLLQSPFELVREKKEKFKVKKRMRRDDSFDYEKVAIKEECEGYEIMQVEEKREVVRKKTQRAAHEGSDGDLDLSNGRDEALSRKEECQTLLDIAMLSVQKLSSVYGGKTSACKQLSLDLLKNQYALTCKEHPAMAEFEVNLKSVCEDIPLASPVAFLNCNAHFLVDVHDAVEQQVLSFEKEIISSAEVKLGRDKLPKFSNFVNMPESATSRYIHMACDVLSPRTSNRSKYSKYWAAFCKEKKNPSRLSVNHSNRFNNYFEAAAGLIHHHREISPFFSDLLSLNNETCPNIVLESVAADANDPVIQSLVCVLAIVYCKILGPYWQLLKSTGEYSLFGRYILGLYQKFLDWSKDPSTLLEPEETTDVFLQFPLQERTFEGVFDYCGHWHTNRDLIRTCLKRTVKAIAAVTDEHLKDFLPGGTFSQVPSTDLSLRLASCTFSVLMAEYPFGDEEQKPAKSSKRSSNVFSDSSQEDENLSGLSDDSFDGHEDHGSSPQARKGGNKEKAGRFRPEEMEVNMDKDYIMATVSKNGGPCKSQQDVDKMMLRFDGKSRAEKWEAVRCEIEYHRMILNNTNPHLNFVYRNTTQMVLKLKLALPRVKPGYSLVWAPRMTKLKRVAAPAADQTENSSTLKTQTYDV
ncbi:solute carrier family 52, riboflavin transporter, member 2 isoform X1 [Mugil cephalus]|uniref:solute carrier family 52, riboflavin transporter, member 2 isoform X1 n=1 Tax=Mugil cephalus TaxID=48193 RepID=UPI001FB67D60|nr:solute carrier family 52, riboflavin transporter, member 2 isoform X1 [Mugil cephalus]